MPDLLHYLILDAYPSPLSESFELYQGAHIGCWLKRNLASSKKDAQDYATEDVQSNSHWLIAGLEEHRFVDESTYPTIDSDGFEYYKQCLTDGFVACIHTYPHEIISMRESEDDFQMTIVQVAEQLAQHGATTLYSENRKQWANGISPDGENFIPIWPGAEPPGYCYQDWPGYRNYGRSTNQLIHDLKSIHEIDYCIGLGTNMTTLVTVHPLALLEAVESYS